MNRIDLHNTPIINAYNLACSATYPPDTPLQSRLYSLMKFEAGQLTFHFNQEPDCLSLCLQSSLSNAVNGDLPTRELGFELEDWRTRVKEISSNLTSKEQVHKVIFIAEFLLKSYVLKVGSDFSELETVLKTLSNEPPYKNESIYLQYLVFVLYLRDGQTEKAFQRFQKFFPLIDLPNPEKNPFLVKLNALLHMSVHKYEEASKIIDRGLQVREIYVDWLIDFKCVQIECLRKSGEVKKALEMLNLVFPTLDNYNIYFKLIYWAQRFLSEFAQGDWEEALKSGTHYFTIDTQVSPIDFEIASAMAFLCRSKGIELDSRIVNHFKHYWEEHLSAPPDKKSANFFGDFLYEILLSIKLIKKDDPILNLLFLACPRHTQLLILNVASEGTENQFNELFDSLSKDGISEEMYYRRAYRNHLHEPYNTDVILRDIQEALKQNPHHVPALELRVEVNLFLRKYEDAEKDLKLIYKLTGDKISTLRNLSTVYINLKTYLKALDPINTYLKKHPHDSAVLILRSIVYVFQQRYSTAEQELIKAAQIPNLVMEKKFEILVQQFKVGFLLAYFPENKESILEIIQYLPKYSTYLTMSIYNLLTVLQDLLNENYKEAAKTLELFLSYNQEKELTLLYLAYCYYRLNETDKALLSLRKCVKSCETFLPAKGTLLHAALALKLEIWESLGKPAAIVAEDVALFAGNVSLPIRKRAFVIYVNACLEIKKFDKALSLCNTMRKNLPNDPVVIEKEKEIQNAKQSSITYLNPLPLTPRKFVQENVEQSYPIKKEGSPILFVPPTASSLLEKGFAQRYERYGTRRKISYSPPTVYGGNSSTDPNGLQWQITETFSRNYKRQLEKIFGKFEEKQVETVQEVQPKLVIFTEKENLSVLKALDCLNNLEEILSKSLETCSDDYMSRWLRYYLFTFCEFLKPENHFFENIISQRVIDGQFLRNLRNWLASDGHRLDVKALKIFCKKLLQNQLNMKLGLLLEGNSCVFPFKFPPVSLLLPKDFSFEWKSLSLDQKKRALLEICQLELEFVKRCKGHPGQAGLQEVLKTSILTIGKALSRLYKECQVETIPSKLKEIILLSRKIRHPSVDSKDGISCEQLLEFLSQCETYQELI